MATARYGTIAMKIFVGALIGAICCVIAIPPLGFVLGGIARAAPCHSAPDFVSGGLFGMMAFTYFLFLPACGVGAVAGGIVAARRARKANATGEAAPTGVRLPRFGLRDLLLGTLLISIGLAGFVGLRRYVGVEPSSSAILVILILEVASTALIGAGFFAPFHRKKLGALVGPTVGIFFFVVRLFILTN